MSDVKNKVYKRSHEPIFWGLFGAGGMLTAFITPIMVLITGILIPLSILGREDLSYEKVHGFATSWYGAVIIFVLIALPLWHTLHRVFHGLHDLGIGGNKTVQRVICYGFAFTMTVFVFTLLLQIG